MFKDFYAFSGFSVDDLAVAKSFYAGTLGLHVEEDTEMGLLTIHLGKGGDVMIYPKPNHQPATFTILNFVVPDIEKAVDELLAKSVQFEHYEGFSQNAKGIADNGNHSIAWFKDPAGNILAVIEEKK